MFALGFPKSAYIDAENGTTFYEGTDKAEQVVGFLETQSFKDITQQTKELVKLMKKGDKTFETLVIDSETKIYENLQEALLTVDEKRAREKGQDALDANISMRSWGKIKQKARSMQNMKLQLASTGMNIVSIAQPKDTMEDLGNGKRIKVGIEPDMKKQAKFDYDVVLRFYTEDGKYYAQVEKDRTEAHLRDEIIENPSFEDWAEVIADRKDLKAVDVDYNVDTEKAKASYEKELDNEDLDSLPKTEQIKVMLGELSQDDKKEFAGRIKTEIGITGTLSKASDDQLTQALELLKTDFA